MRHIIFSLFLTACQTPSEWAKAYQIENLKEVVGGPKAIAQVNDFVLENDRIRVSVLSARPSMGNHTEGGSILDGDLQRANPAYSKGHGLDQLGELFPSVNLQVASIQGDDTNIETFDGQVQIISDGSGGGPAIICTVGDGQGFISLLNIAKPYMGGDIRIRTDYILDPGSPAILLRSYLDPNQTITCDDAMPEAPAANSTDGAIPLIDVVTTGGWAFGDFTLFGGGVDVFTPSVGFDEEGHVSELMDAGVNTFVDPIVADYLGGTSDSVSYAYMATEGSLSIPMFTGSQTAGFGAYVAPEDVIEGSGYIYERWFGIGRGDMGSALDAVLEASGKETGRIEGWVVEKGTGVALSDIHVFAYRPEADGPWTEWTTDIGDDIKPDGSFSGNLPPGRWDLVVYAEGRPVGPKVPVTVAANETVNVVLESPQPGSVSYEVTDGSGFLIPAKVTFFRADGTDIRRTDLGDGYIGGKPAQVSFSAHGTGNVVLPPGKYYAVASRGFEYEIDISPVFELNKNTHYELVLAVEHTVDTWGWISADFHVHASPSPDSGVSLPDRVTTFVAEGVEFLASSDHDAITDYQPTIQAMNLEPWLSSTPGTEVTTIEIGHYLGFPLKWEPLEDQGGALDWTGLAPQGIIDELRLMGEAEIVEPVVFIAHPRDGILGYFDQYGFDPFSGTVDNAIVEPDLITSLANDQISPEQFTMDFDAMEILNAKRLEMLRTATSEELVSTTEDPGSVSIYDILSRTEFEQDSMIDGTMTLGGDYPGPLDDWFTLLNLGYRITALGNSDTHSKTKTEAGCPRNYVAIGTDDPAEISPADVAEAVREGRVVASYGPFIRFGIDTWENGPGTTVEADGEITLNIEVQSPSWFEVDRVELYENGTLIQDWELEDNHDPLIDLAIQVLHTPEQDSWYVVIALGEDDLSPLFTPVDIMPIQLQDIVNGAISEIELGALDLSSFASEGPPIPRTFPIHPFAVTNPVWVDMDGQEGFNAPGIPSWLVPPVEAE